MPQLHSGRHFGLAPSTILQQITEGTDESRSAWMMQFRTLIRTPIALLDTVGILYFREDEGTPPHAPTYYSGWLVGDVRAGKSDWTSAEVTEFEAWLQENPRLQTWLQAEFDRIDEAIKTSPVWQSPLWMDD